MTTLDILSRRFRSPEQQLQLRRAVDRRRRQGGRWRSGVAAGRALKAIIKGGEHAEVAK